MKLIRPLSRLVKAALSTPSNGEMLKAAKDKVGHGNWETWLAKNCSDIPPRTASRYMRMAKNGEKLEKAAEQNGHALADLSTTAAERLLRTPKTEAEKAAAKAEKEKKQKIAQEQARVDWIKSLDPSGLCELFAGVWDQDNLSKLADQLKKKLIAVQSPLKRPLFTSGLDQPGAMR